MELIQTNTDALNAIVTIKIAEADYKPQLEKGLKAAAKKVSMPGFRPGTVPMSMVKKNHGKAILLQELNKTINAGLAKYLVDNKLEVLGQPLPVANHAVDIEKGGELEFKYELGIAPKVEINFTKPQNINYYKVIIDNELLFKYKNDVSRRNGSYESPETVGEADLVYIDLVELDANGEILPGGIFCQSTLAIDMINSASFKAAMIGKTKDSIVRANVKDIASSSIDLASMLNMNKSAAEQVTSDFNVKIGTISRVVPATLNQEFFDKMYGEGVIKTDEDFNAKINVELGNLFANDSDRKLRYEIQTHLLNTINPTLPDTFLKRWIRENNKTYISPEQMETQYEGYSKALKVQIIESKVLAEYKLGINHAEVIDATKQLIIDQYLKNSTETIDDVFLVETANKILQKEEEYRRVSDMVLDKKLVGLYKEKFNLTTVELNYADFVKKMNEA
jgi:trigger factor